MPAPADLPRQLSKLVAALERQWQEELGSPAAAATASVLHRTQRLLRAVASGQAPHHLGDQGFRGDLDAGWIEENSWAVKHLASIDAAIKQLPARAIPPHP